MAFKPLHDRVLVRRVESTEKTKGGLIIPDSAKEKPAEGLVVACGEGAGFGGVSPSVVLARIDWQGFIGFVVLKTVPFFWIPAHTVTFLLPPEYRVLVAASLSIALGAILAYAKRKKTGAQ